jgi:hypothetical protein
MHQSRRDVRPECSCAGRGGRSRRAADDIPEERVHERGHGLAGLDPVGKPNPVCHPIDELCVGGSGHLDGHARGIALDLGVRHLTTCHLRHVPFLDDDLDDASEGTTDVPPASTGRWGRRWRVVCWAGPRCGLNKRRGRHAAHPTQKPRACSWDIPSTPDRASSLSERDGCRTDHRHPREASSG